MHTASYRRSLCDIPEQNKIIELIENNEIDTQEKLAALLKECGFEVTQATISRDIKELQVGQDAFPER